MKRTAFSSVILLAASILSSCGSIEASTNYKIENQIKRTPDRSEFKPFADLSNTDSRGMNLSNVDLSGAYLEYAYMSHTNLTGAKFSSP